jgi:NADH dehydrogenase [ubiquinone] 1 alpha subcomplex assembly factor 6
MQKNTLSYCGELVRQNDHDGFLISLFAPATVREDIWSVLAFNHEITKTRAVVSESTLGLIRLQWWRDQIAAIYAGAPVPAHEVLMPLAKAIQTHSLKHTDFEMLIHAREFDLEDVLPGNLEGLMNYADFTTTPLLKILVSITGDEPDVLPAQPVGINYGLAGILMAAPYHARAGRCYWPEDLLIHHGLTKEDFYNFEKPQGFSEVVKKICGAQVKGISIENRVLRAADISSDIYFSRLKSLKYNIFSPNMAVPPPFKALRLTLRAGF